MRIELLEKIVFALAVLAIVLVAALVGVFSFVIQQSSGISKAEETATINVDDWLAAARRAAAGQNGPISNVLYVAPPASGGAAGGGVAVTPGKPGAPAAGGTPAAPHAQPGQPDNYIARQGESIPPQEQVPDIVYQRYQGFDEAFQAAQQGAGEFVDGKYKINWVDPNSLLATKVGIQQGDQIISVNGHPVGGSFSAGRQLYDSLKGEKRFAVKVLRGGQETMLSFYVN